MNINAYMNSLMLIGELVGKPTDISKTGDMSVAKFKIKVITKPYDKNKPNVEQEIPVIAGKYQAAIVLKMNEGDPILVKGKLTVKQFQGKNGEMYDSISVVAVDLAPLNSAVHKASKDVEPEFDDDIPF